MRCTSLGVAVARDGGPKRHWFIEEQAMIHKSLIKEMIGSRKTITTTTTNVQNDHPYDENNERLEQKLLGNEVSQNAENTVSVP